MTHGDYERFRNWFSNFGRDYYGGTEEDRRNIALKELHTKKVCENIGLIAADEGLPGGDRLIALTVALFHDLGRFPQYRKYRTFNDAVSVNHGELGADVLSKSGLLETLPPSERELITLAVRYHNAFSLPRIEDGRAILFLKLIRDADKLDIWRVFLELFGQKREERASAAGIGLPDSPGYSGQLVPVILEGKIIPLARVKNLNDYKLLQLSWIFGLYFRASYRLVKERGIIEKMSAYLPQTEEIENALRHLKGFVSGKVG